MTLKKRILIHAGGTAIALGLIGWMLAEMAGTWAASQSTRADATEQGDAITSTLRSTLPLTLAAAGFLFVAVGETLLAIWRKN